MNAREQAAFDILTATVSDMALHVKEACVMLAEDDKPAPLTLRPLDTGAVTAELEEIRDEMDFEVKLGDDNGVMEVRRIVREVQRPAKAYHIPAAEFYAILTRAVNTLEPQKMPQWASELHDRLWQHEGTIKLVLE